MDEDVERFIVWDGQHFRIFDEEIDTEDYDQVISVTMPRSISDNFMGIQMSYDAMQMLIFEQWDALADESNYIKKKYIDAEFNEIMTEVSCDDQDIRELLSRFEDQS